MKFDVKTVIIYVGSSALVIVGFSVVAIGIFFFYTEGRDLLDYMLHQEPGLVGRAGEISHLLISCIVIIIGLLIGYIGIFILKDHRYRR